MLNRLIKGAKEQVRPQWERIDELKLLNQRKVLRAFQQNRISDYHLTGTTGYGYSDPGREGLEDVFCSIFKGERALVRPQIVSGTHALSLCLSALLGHGEELISVTGPPYDTLRQVIGTIGSAPNNLLSRGITYQEVPLTKEGGADLEAISRTVSPQTRLVLIQRSRGYSWRPALKIGDIARIVKTVKEVNKDTICLVDNCYGEFVEEMEPLEAGADLIAGSLIKNPGGTLAPTGGYVVGRGDYIELIAAAMTAPGIAEKVGPMLNTAPILFQGIFQAPHTVGESLQGGVLAAYLFHQLGYPVEPLWDQPRGDSVQAIQLGSAEAIKAFCLGIQRAGAINGFVQPEAAPMPGYDDHVIMAGGTFIQGSSSELSADAPIRPPFIVYMQGGMSKEHIEIGLASALEELDRQRLLEAGQEKS
ncbi:MAG: aminotransferase class I/II-fold pyridoxal phosphate-dependent enzyme [Limnochordia bacterium]|jgi:cystathionine beta-lyase family protein involved in aluminum resistance